MQRNIDRVRRLFTVTIMGLCVASMACLLLVLYVSSGVSFSQKTSPQELENLTAGYPAVAQYLKEQKQSEAHFVTLATLIKEDQQRLLGRTALLAAIPVLGASALLGYMLARYLLRPVAEAYVSQERFLQDASHELRNPLATMSVVIQQAKQADKQAGNAAQLDILERQTNHLVHINENLLFLERKQKRTPQPVNITNLAHDVAETLQPAARLRNVKVTVRGKAAHLPIERDDFVCMLRNIMENAIKYSKDGKPGRVQVRIEQTPRAITLRVTDAGIGIPEAEVAHIGKRFYRAQNVSRREGTGLGFAIVRKVAADYNADVQLSSVVGRSTTVTIIFKT